MENLKKYFQNTNVFEKLKSNFDNINFEFSKTHLCFRKLLKSFSKHECVPKNFKKVFFDTQNSKFFERRLCFRKLKNLFSEHECISENLKKVLKLSVSFYFVVTKIDLKKFITIKN